jgi:hypothetical protein
MRSWHNTTTGQGKLQAFTLLSRGLAQRPEVYAVSPDDAAEALRLVDAMREAFEVADNPATRTPLTIAAKRAAMEAAEKYCSRLVAFIRANPNVSDADRAAIGVPPPVTEKRRIPPPTTEPILSIAGIIPGGHRIEIFDSASPDRRGRARDTRGLELFVAYSPNHGGSGLGMDQLIRSATPIAILTRGMSSVIHPDERVGSVANYIGRWINGRGEAGPWSHPVRMLLAMPSGEQPMVPRRILDTTPPMPIEAAQRDAA